MKELNFKEKFPELNDNQLKMLQRELLEIIGPDLEHKHMTREYDRGCQDRDLVNSHKRAIRSRLQTYLHDEQPTPHNEK